MFVGDRKMQKSNVKLVRLDVKENDIIFNGERNLLEDLEKIQSRYDIFKMTGEGDCNVFGHIKGPACAGLLEEKGVDKGQGNLQGLV